jgi:hypothetical protein
MVALLAAGVAGCTDPLVQRVSNEFECEPARVNVLERHDIAYTVYDVEACGRRGRYSCVGGGHHGVYGCVHEPDPPTWDPDPALAANLPAPRVSDPSAPSSNGRRRRICGPDDDACAFKQNGTWQWRPAAVPSGGCGSLCQ